MSKSGRLIIKRFRTIVADSKYVVNYRVYDNKGKIMYWGHVGSSKGLRRTKNHKCKDVPIYITTTKWLPEKRRTITSRGR